MALDDFGVNLPDPKPKVEKDFTYSEAETAVAIMGELATIDWPNDEVRAALEGHMGVYRLVLALGKAVERMVASSDPDGWEAFNFYLTADAVAIKLSAVDDRDDIPRGDDEQDAFVRTCLVDN